MNQDLTTRTIWGKAGVAGAALGIFSSIFIFLSMAIDGISSAVITGGISIVLWAVKFVGCILIMRHFMKRLCQEYEGVGNADTFRLGMITALLSALIYSAAYLANILFISPDVFAGQMESMTQMYAPMLDSNSMSVLQKMEDNFPQISFFSNLIYCAVYGTVLSAILSRNIPRRDPFADSWTRQQPDDQD